MDRRQDCHPLRWRALGLCNGLVRRILADRNSSFTWNVDNAGIRYCENSEPDTSLHQLDFSSCDPSGNGSVRRLRDYAPNTSIGFASMRERRLFQIHQQQLALKPLEEITLMTLASFEKDQIMQAISALCGRSVVATNYRTTFLQYLQLCRSSGIQFLVPLSQNSTQCLVCLQHASVPMQRFRCSCITFQFEYLQDCNCECGISFLCMCDLFPSMCYDLDVLANIVSVTWQQFLDYFVRTDPVFTDQTMSPHDPEEFCDERGYNASSPSRYSQFEPP